MGIIIFLLSKIIMFCCLFYILMQIDKLKHLKRENKRLINKQKELEKQILELQKFLQKKLNKK